jgi:protein-disulfide isomerase
MRMRLPSGLTAFALLSAAAAGCAGPKLKIHLSDSARLGDEDAPIEVVIFSDFQCVFCKRAAAELRRAYRSRPSRIKIIFKHFPLSYHPQAVNAAKAAEAARMQGKFWEMHDILYANSAELDDDVYRRLATEIGLDVDRFEKDMGSSMVADKVSRDRMEGEKLGVDGTPYILINRTRFRGSYSDLPMRLDGLEGLK